MKIRILSPSLSISGAGICGCWDLFVYNVITAFLHFKMVTWGYAEVRSQCLFGCKALLIAIVSRLINVLDFVAQIIPKIASYFLRNGLEIDLQSRSAGISHLFKVLPVPIVFCTFFSVTFLNSCLSLFNWSLIYSVQFSY
jgi:hypothetical protein